MMAEDYLEAMRQAGFVEISWERSDAGAIIDVACHDPELRAELEAMGEETIADLKERIWSYRVEAHKPPRSPERYRSTVKPSRSIIFLRDSLSSALM